MRAFAPSLCAALLLSAAIAVIGVRDPGAERLEWQDIGALAAPRAYGSAVALPTGEILVFGGLDRKTENVASHTSELFDPRRGTARVIDHPLPGRVQPIVGVTPGRVVVAGGSEWRGDHWDVVDRTDVFNTYDHRWVRAAPMLHGRTGHVGTVLRDGRLFVTGGYDGPRLIGTSEIYDPVSDTWKKAASMPTVRADFAITTLNDGRVLVAGGLAGRSSIVSLTSLYYDVVLDRWSDGPPLIYERVLHSQVRLPNGDLLLVGGQNGGSGSAERYDARRGAFVPAGTLVLPRMAAEAAALPDGRALVTGGLPVYPGEREMFDPTDRTELWDPSTNLWQEVAPVRSGRAFARLVATSLGIYQLSGAAEGDTAQARVERFVWR